MHQHHTYILTRIIKLMKIVTLNQFQIMEKQSLMLKNLYKKILIRKLTTQLEEYSVLRRNIRIVVILFQPLRRKF